MKRMIGAALLLALLLTGCSAGEPAGKQGRIDMIRVWDGAVVYSTAEEGEIDRFMELLMGENGGDEPEVRPPGGAVEEYHILYCQEETVTLLMRLQGRKRGYVEALRWILYEDSDIITMSSHLPGRGSVDIHWLLDGEDAAYLRSLDS